MRHCTVMKRLLDKQLFCKRQYYASGSICESSYTLLQGLIGAVYVCICMLQGVLCKWEYLRVIVYLSPGTETKPRSESESQERPKNHPCNLGLIRTLDREPLRDQIRSMAILLWEIAGGCVCMYVCVCVLCAYVHGYARC
jgi:hypothetical protein